jgi:hypothetical protein
MAMRIHDGRHRNPEPGRSAGTRTQGHRQMLQSASAPFRCRSRSTPTSACSISTCRRSSRKNG